MPSLGPTELVIILVLALVLFGAGKLSEVGGALGKSIKEFRRAADEDDKPKRAAEEPGTPPKSTT
jgi:sec-independent protein translocase protein TatA